MAKINSRHEWAQSVARNMGLDPDLVRRIEIVIDSEEVVHARVLVLIDTEKSKELMTQLVKLAWVDK